MNAPYPNKPAIQGKPSLKSTKKSLGHAALAQAMKAATSKAKPTTQVTLTDVLAESLRFFRGAPGFARRLYIQYLKAPSGSQTRTKILEIILKMLMIEASRSGIGSGTDTNDMTEDEITAEENRIMKQGMEPDAGDPKGMSEALQLEEAVENMEAEDPEIAELDEEIRQMETLEDGPGDLQDLIGKLGKEVDDEHASESDQSA